MELFKDLIAAQAEKVKKLEDKKNILEATLADLHRDINEIRVQTRKRLQEMIYEQMRVLMDQHPHYVNRHELSFTEESRDQCRCFKDKYGRTVETGATDDCNRKGIIVCEECDIYNYLFYKKGALSEEIKNKAMVTAFEQELAQAIVTSLREKFGDGRSLPLVPPAFDTMPNVQICHHAREMKSDNCCNFCTN